MGSSPFPPQAQQSFSEREPKPLSLSKPPFFLAVYQTSFVLRACYCCGCWFQGRFALTMRESESEQARCGELAVAFRLLGTDPTLQCWAGCCT